MRCHILRLPPSALQRFISTAPHLTAKSADPKATGVGSANRRSRGVEENRAGRGVPPPRPFNLFAAGASRRRTVPQETGTDAEPPLLSREKWLYPPEKPLSAEEWERLRGEFEGKKKFEELMFDQLIAHNRPLEVAKSLLAAVVRREGDVQYGLLVKFLVLCVSQKEVEEMHDVYDIMRSRYKTLDPSASSLLIRGLSGSPRWRDALPLLEELRKVITPSKGNYGDCIRGALRNREIGIACELLREMLRHDLVPHLETLQVFFETGKAVKDDQLRKELLHILSYLRDNQVYPGEALMESIKQWFESILGENWKGNITTVSNSGQCLSCNQYLENINLSPQEYNTLKEKVIKDVIKGMDTFRKTTPQELEQFQNFVNQRPPFDIVIDGLNVGRVCSKSNPSQTHRLFEEEKEVNVPHQTGQLQLLDVVTHLAEQNLRVLVLGRKHMMNGSRQWTGNNMALMQKKADFFFTENISEDDPFLLYATLHSGNHCRFVTRDLLRDHKACLTDSLTRRLFFKWQRGHQMVLSNYTPGKRIKFEPVLCYDTVVQTTGDTWHIPYDDHSLERSSCEVPTKWLCLQQK